MGVEDALIRSVLGGRSAAAPVGLDAGAFVHAARLHRVLPLLDRSLQAMPGWPSAIAEACHEAAIDHVASEVVQRAELVRVLGAFATAGIAPLVLKGAALAYLYYPEPALRFREDADLFVPDASVEAAGAVLRALGYAKRASATGAHTASQSSWDFADARGMWHHVDLHWRINNAHLLEHAITYTEASADAVPIPALGPHARGLSPVHALLLACAHRAGHRQDAHFVEDPAHPGGDRLVWFQDMRLIAERFGDEDWRAFAGLAEAKRLRAVCREALAIAARDLAAPVPRAVLQRLSAPGPREPSALLLDGRPLSRLRGELLAIPGAAGRLQYLREVAFPSSAFLRQKYAGAAVRWLPWLYVRRGFEGAWKLAVPRRRIPPR